MYDKYHFSFVSLRVYICLQGHFLLKNVEVFSHLVRKQYTKQCLQNFLSLKLVFGCLFVVFIHMGCYNFIAFTYFRNIINIEMKNKKKEKKITE